MFFEFYYLFLISTMAETNDEEGKGIKSHLGSIDDTMSFTMKCTV